MHSSQRHDQYQLDGEKLYDILLHHVSSIVCSHSAIKSLSVNAGPVSTVTRLRGWMSEE